jgi:hypothetical protein
MTAPSKRYHRLTKDAAYQFALLRLKLFRAFKGGLLTHSELTEKLLTIGGFTLPIHAAKFIMDMDRRSLEDSSTLSYRERKRRELITAYNKGRLDESQLERAIMAYFINDGTHPKNQTTIKTTKDLHLYLACRSVRYTVYLLANYPSIYNNILEQPKLVRKKLDLDARQLRVSKLLEQIRKENNHE